MSLSNTTMIAITEAKAHVKPNDSLEDRLRAAMRATYRHWMETDEDAQLRAAVGAVLLSASPDEKERIERELRVLRGLNAMLSGVPVDLERLADETDKATESIGLLRLWDEIKGGPDESGGSGRA